MAWKCLLDAAGTLQGYEEINQAAAQPNDIVFASKPDLEPGHYTWNGDCFMPVRRRYAFVPDGPDAWEAVVAALVRWQQNTDEMQKMLAILKQLPALQNVTEFQKLNLRDLPAPTKQFIRYFTGSIQRQPVDPGE